MESIVKMDGWTGQIDADAERFFRRPLWEIGTADLIRWKAACAAMFMK